VGLIRSFFSDHWRHVWTRLDDTINYLPVLFSEWQSLAPSLPLPPLFLSPSLPLPPLSLPLSLSLALSLALSFSPMAKLTGLINSFYQFLLNAEHRGGNT